MKKNHLYAIIIIFLIPFVQSFNVDVNQSFYNNFYDSFESNPFDSDNWLQVVSLVNGSLIGEQSVYPNYALSLPAQTNYPTHTDNITVCCYINFTNVTGGSYNGIEGSQGLHGDGYFFGRCDDPVAGDIDPPEFDPFVWSYGSCTSPQTPSINKTVQFDNYTLLCMSSTTGNKVTYSYSDKNQNDFTTFASVDNAQAIWGSSLRVGDKSNQGNAHTDGCFAITGNVTHIVQDLDSPVMTSNLNQTFTTNVTGTIDLTCADMVLGQMSINVTYYVYDFKFNLTGGYFYYTRNTTFIYSELNGVPATDTLTINIVFNMSGNGTIDYTCVDDWGQETTEQTFFNVIDSIDEAVPSANQIDIFDYDFSVATNVYLFMGLAFFYLGMMFFAFKIKNALLIFFGFFIGMFLGLLLISFSAVVGIVFILMNILICLKASDT